MASLNNAIDSLGILFVRQFNAKYTHKQEKFLFAIILFQNDVQFIVVFVMLCELFRTFFLSFYLSL